MLNLKSHKPEHILTCISYCGKIDRLYKIFAGASGPDNKILEINAGMSPELEPGSRNDMISKGVLEWLREFHDNPASFSLSNTYVKSLHRKLFKYSRRDDGTRGHYRADLDAEMKELFEATKEELASEERHPLFTISLFRVSFINIMPFITGNTLSANLIAYALLYLQGYAFVSQLPLLPSLNDADSAISKDTLSILPKTLFKLLITAPRLTHPADSGQPTPEKYLNPRRKSLLGHIQQHAPLKISDIMTAFSNESRNTVKKDLIYLRENNLIVANGRGRGMYYSVISYS